MNVPLVGGRRHCFAAAETYCIDARRTSYCSIIEQRRSVWSGDGVRIDVNPAFAVMAIMEMFIHHEGRYTKYNAR